MALVPTNYTSDWLYGRVTPVCDESLTYDYFPSDPIPRFQMACLWLLLVIVIAFIPAQEKGQPEASEAAKPAGKQDRFMSNPSPSGGRWVFLDVVRIAAVTCVVTEHGGGDDYSRRNVLFTAQWTLPSLFLTSGIAFMFSRSPAVSFYSRLVSVFLLGVGCNALADGAFNKRPGWYCDFGNTVYQMFYVVVIMALSLATTPLRLVLREHAHPTGSMLARTLSYRTLFTLLYGTIALVWIGIYLGWADWSFLTGDDDDVGSGDDANEMLTNETQADEAADGPVDLCHPQGTGSHETGQRWARSRQHALAQLPYMVAHVCGFPALVCWHAFLRKRADGLLTWLLLLYIYLPCVFFPCKDVLIPHMALMYMLGLVHQAMPLLGSPAVRDWLRAYWMLYLLFLLFLYQPPLLGRCDLWPALTVWERFRWYMPEVSLMVMVLTRTVDASDPHEIIGVLSWWSLFAYITHVLWIRILPLPYGVVATYCFIPVFFGIGNYKRYLRARREASRADDHEAAPIAAPADGVYGTFAEQTKQGGGAAR